MLNFLPLSLPPPLSSLPPSSVQPSPVEPDPEPDLMESEPKLIPLLEVHMYS